MRPVLSKPRVAGLHVAELALEDSERMLDLGPHLRDDPVDLFVDLIQLTPPSSSPPLDALRITL